MDELSYLGHLKGRFRSVVDMYARGDKTVVPELRELLRKIMELK